MNTEENTSKSASQTTADKLKALELLGKPPEYYKQESSEISEETRERFNKILEQFGVEEKLK